MHTAASAGYPATPHQGLSAFLRRQCGKSLVLLAQDMAHWHVGELAASANQAAIAHGYHLISLDFHRCAARERALLEAMCEVRVGGVILLWDHSPCNLDLYARLAHINPCVGVVDPKPIDGIDFVGVDEYDGGLLATRHLINLGYRQIKHVTLHAPLRCLPERQRGYLAAIKEAQLSFKDDWILALPYGLTDSDRTKRRPAILRFLAQAQLPCALFVCADWVASEVIECAHELGLSIPEDFAIVGYDDARPHALTSVPLTTIRIDLQKIGQLAVERLLQRQRGGDHTEQNHVCIVPQLVVRASSVRIIATSERWNVVVRYIHEHYRRTISVREVADVIGLDPQYFSHQFRRVFGRRFTDYVQDLRLQYATQLLASTEHTITDIAHASGFQSLNHFYTLFKRTRHTSPHAYRKQHSFE